MRKGNRIAVALAFTALFSTAALADAPDGTGRIFASYFSPTGSHHGRFDVGGGRLAEATIEADEASGMTFGWEIRVGKRMGIETDIMITKFDFNVKTSGITVGLGSAVMVPITTSLQWHLTDNRRMDFYVGPVVSYTLWGDLDTPVGSTPLDGEFRFGLRGGIDVPFSVHWALAARLDYLQAAAGDASLEIDVDPVVFSIGLGYRY